MVELRRRHPEADEDEGSTHPASLVHEVRRQQVVLAVLQPPCHPLPIEGQGAFAGHEVGFAKGNGLKVRSIVPGGLETHGLELSRNVIGRKLVTARPRAAPFEQVIRQKTYMRPNGVGTDRLERGGGPAASTTHTRGNRARGLGRKGRTCDLAWALSPEMAAGSMLDHVGHLASVGVVRPHGAEASLSY